MTLNNLVRSVRPTGVLGVVGCLFPMIREQAPKTRRRGRITFNMREFWSRGQRMATGQTPVKAYNRYLRRIIHEGRAQPSFIVAHEIPLEAAPDAYGHFDAREHGWTKVAESIRSATWGKTTMLGAVTGWGREDDRKRAFAVGFNHHLTKPITAEALESLLHSLH